MPRKARKMSSTSIYHIVIRGLDRQIMFECDKDFKKYLEILDNYKAECDFELYAYCLMSNHVHLLIKTGTTRLDTIFRKINTHYAVWFNMKYQRTGHLQQERFYSEAVEDKLYFINVLRYIHRNPLNAGLEASIGDTYKWSSIHEYNNNTYNLIDSKFVFNLISYTELQQFTNYETNYKYMDIDTLNIRIPDDVAKEIICETYGCSNCLDFNKVELKLRDKYIRDFHSKGVSIRQINRLTGLSRGVIQRALK